MGTGWDDRQERTRSDVLQAAGELIAGGGVESLSMRRLAERAGVAVGTLYNQFGDRDGILVAFVSNGLDGLERSLDEDAAADPIDATRQVFEGLDATIASAIDVWKPVFAVITTSPDLAGMGAVGDRFVQLVEGDLGKAAAAGMFAKDIDVERLARHIFNTRIAAPRTVGRRFDRLGPVPRLVASRPRDHAGRGVGRASRHAGDAALRPADVTTPVVASVVHRRHAPLAEIESSGLQSPWEHPGRADAIHDVLAADDRFAIADPDEWGTDPIAAVHDPGLVEFLSRAWGDYQILHPGTHDVVPDVFASAGLLDGIGPIREELPVVAELGRWCFETTTPLTEGTYEAARGAVDVALERDAAGPRRRRPCVRPVPPTGPSRPTGVVRRLLLLQQCCRRGAPRRVDHRLPGDGARRRLPPRQRDAADLLRPRRRPVRVAAR